MPAALSSALGDSSSQRLTAMITDIVETTIAGGYVDVSISPPNADYVSKLRLWLYDLVYRADVVDDEFRKASRLLRVLFSYYFEKPNEMMVLFGYKKAYAETEIMVTDFLAGMTDRYAMKLYQKLFLPQPWKAL
mgnify:CR=1 FL=1